MTTREVRAKARAIAEQFRSDKDDEKAHSQADSLQREVLRAIARGDVEDAPGMARAALSVERCGFARWCG